MISFLIETQRKSQQVRVREDDGLLRFDRMLSPPSTIRATTASFETPSPRMAIRSMPWSSSGSPLSRLPHRRQAHRSIQDVGREGQGREDPGRSPPRSDVDHLESLEDVPPHLLKEIERFFAMYKELEEKKTGVEGWKESRRGHPCHRSHARASSPMGCETEIRKQTQGRRGAKETSPAFTLSYSEGVGLARGDVAGGGDSPTSSTVRPMSSDRSTPMMRAMLPPGRPTASSHPREGESTRREHQRRRPRQDGEHDYSA